MQEIMMLTTPFTSCYEFSPNLPFAKTSKDLLQELTDLILDELQIGG